jgi:hypothetical protein
VRINRPIRPVVIPETSGTVLVGFWDGSGDPVEVSHVRYPVIGWIVTCREHGGVDDVEPIVCESLPDVWCLELRPAGGPPVWIFVEDATVDTFEEALAIARERFMTRRQKRT